MESYSDLAPLSTPAQFHGSVIGPIHLLQSGIPLAAEYSIVSQALELALAARFLDCCADGVSGWSVCIDEGMNLWNVDQMVSIV